MFIAAWNGIMIANSGIYILTILYLLYMLQFNELEKLGFSGFAFGFFEEDMHWAGTSDTVECSVDPKFTEYLHAVILSSKL